MKVVFIGAGNVATHLATELFEHKLDIVQVYSRSEASSKSLADAVNAAFTTDIEKISTEADLYVFSVKDSVLSDLIGRLPSNNGVWIHTAGSIPMNVFDGYASRYGVFYPFQTFSKGRSVNWSDIPLFIEANDTETLLLLHQLSSLLSENVRVLPSDKRMFVHLTGVFACNFTNHMYALSEAILSKAGLPFDIALPLIDETCMKVHSLSPFEAQTGPALRLDKNVMDKQLEIIDNDRVKEIYRLLSLDIHEMHSSNNDLL